jgi:hypothetical protein
MCPVINPPEMKVSMWRGHIADMWKSICTLVSILQYHAPILHYNICLTCKYCHIIEFTLVPPFPRPVQDPHPEWIWYPLAPSSRKVASGRFSHQYPRIRIIQPHPLHTTFRLFLTLSFHHFLLYGPGPFPVFIPHNSLEPYPDHRPFTRTYRPGSSLRHIELLLFEWRDRLYLAVSRLRIRDKLNACLSGRESKGSLSKMSEKSATHDGTLVPGGAEFRVNASVRRCETVPPARISSARANTV